jgi:protoporphyrinogen/coproporphyrinogen III oxidase
MLLTNPVFKGAVRGAAMEFFTPKRSPDLEDESVGSFLQRRYGNPHMGDNIASAIIHGIYAGDIYKLSIRSLLPWVWFSEGLYGSIMKGIIAGNHPKSGRDFSVLLDYVKRRSNLARDAETPFASVYTLKRGIGSLSDALVSALKANPRVDIKTCEKVKRISFDSKTDRLKVRAGSGGRHSIR